MQTAKKRTANQAGDDRHGTFRILVVDDNPADQRLIAEFLRSVDGQSYGIDLANSLEQARDALAKPEAGYDAVLLDHDLGDGYSIDLIRTYAPEFPAPLILLTGLASRDIDNAAMDAGAADFLPKDELNPLLLDRTIRHSIERQNTSRELRRNYRELTQANDRLKSTTSQLQAKSANIVKLTEHLAMAPDDESVSLLTSVESRMNQQIVEQASRIGTWHVAPDGTTIELNEPMRVMLCLDDDEPVGGLFWELLGTFNRATAQAELDVWKRGTISSFEAEATRRRPGRLPRMVLSGCPIEDESGSVTSIIISAVDITDRRHVETVFRDLAQRDPLTGLLNRMVFMEMLSSALSNNQRNRSGLAVFYIDLDGFKNINDSFGHHVGDNLLKQAASRLISNTRESDFAARLGGDEFAIVLNNLSSPAGAGRVAEKILDSLRQPSPSDGAACGIKASIGIATFPGDSKSPEELIRNADLALYQCKEMGGDAYRFFDPSMRDLVEQRRRCQLDLGESIETGGFQVAYQPQLDLADDRLVGAEALIRWERPGKGWTAPVDFLPIAEETGLIVPIGTWVLETACRDLAARRQAYSADLRLAVNLSARQLRQPNLAALVESLLLETGFPADRLELEITETAIIDDVDAAIAIFASLRELGIRISLDDFGTGYSSLSILRDIPVDSLKIDRRFVSRVCEGAADTAIVEATITLCKSLGLQVIAEGVESEDQCRALRDLGCDFAQGFLFSRPLFIGAFDSWAGSRAGRGADGSPARTAAARWP